MILQALYEYYQRKAADPGSTIAPHGLEWKEIPYLILIDKKGNFLELQDTTEGVGKQKRAKKYLVVKSKGRTGSNSWQTANVFWDLKILMIKECQKHWTMPLNKIKPLFRRSGGLPKCILPMKRFKQ